MDFIKELLKEVVIALLPVVLGFVIALIKAFIEDLKQNAKHKAEVRLLNIAETVVSGIYQDAVEELKKAGKFNKQVAGIIKNRAIKEIKDELRKEKKGLLKDILNDVNVDKKLSGIIESIIYHKKRGVQVGNIELPISKKSIKGIEFNWKF